MIDQNGILKIVPIGPGEAHLQNEVINKECYICQKPEDDNMALVRLKEKTFVLTCLHHSGVVQEFIRQYGTLPLGWKAGETHGNNIK
jgi:hypothetical protein